MRLTDASVVIRPRSNWEAIDLGILMARRHLGLLMASWAILSLPLAALITLLLWQHPGWALFAFWWLKPLFERMALHILSISLFQAPPTLRQALREFKGLPKAPLFASLTWRRLHPARSFNLPVQQLEGLSGGRYHTRVASLSPSANSSAFALTFCGCFVELILYFSLFSCIYLFIPNQLIEQINWEKLIESGSSGALWLEHISTLIYAIVLIFWGPIYVACGFSLYLNSRSKIEAWDIELTFRRLRQRIIGSAYAILLAITLSFSLPSSELQAKEQHAEPPQSEEEFYDQEHYTSSYRKTAKELFAEPRLSHQPLSADQARSAIREIVSQPPFHHSRIEKRWKLFDGETEFPELNTDNYESAAGFFSTLIRSLLWGLVIGAIVLLLWRYREWLQAFALKLSNRVARKNAPPSTLFGLDIAPNSLPDDIASSAEALWQTDPRQALSLLYRALLSKLLHEYHLRLKSSHTEGEVLQLIQPLRDAALSQYSRELTQHWQNLAYGHRLPNDDVCHSLCAGWRALFMRAPQ